MRVLQRPLASTWRSTQVGRRGAPAKGVGRILTGARVQISPSPPFKSTTVMLWACFLSYKYNLNRKNIWQRYKIVKINLIYEHGDDSLRSNPTNNHLTPKNFIRKNLIPRGDPMVILIMESPLCIFLGNASNSKYAFCP